MTSDDSGSCTYAWRCARYSHIVRQANTAYQLAGHRPDRICPVFGVGRSNSGHSEAVAAARIGTAREIALITLGCLDANVGEY